MAIEETKIIDLIALYEKYEEECQRSLNTVDSSRAALYRTVISDLEDLLPRKTLADIAGGNLEPYLGTWVEVDGKKGLIFNFKADAINVVLPGLRDYNWFESSDAYPLDIWRAWDETGIILR